MNATKATNQWFYLNGLTEGHGKDEKGNMSQE